MVLFFLGVLGDFLAFTDTYRQELYRMAVNGGNHTPSGAPTTFINPIAVAYNPTNSFLYWTERTNEMLNADQKLIGRISLTTNDYEFFSLPQGKKIFYALTFEACITF